MAYIVRCDRCGKDLRGDVWANADGSVERLMPCEALELHYPSRDDIGAPRHYVYEFCSKECLMAWLTEQSRERRERAEGTETRCVE